MKRGWGGGGGVGQFFPAQMFWRLKALYEFSFAIFSDISLLPFAVHDLFSSVKDLQEFFFSVIKKNQNDPCIS